MPQLGQAQTGSLKSTFKQVKVSASDRNAALYKNMGSTYNVPFIWSSSAVVSSGDTAVTLASGVSFYNMDLASYAIVTATPESDPGDQFWITKDTTNNIITLEVGTAVSADTTFDVQFILGNQIDITTLHASGMGSTAQSLP